MFRLLNNKVLSILFSHIISYTTLGNLNDFFLLLRSSVTSVSPLVRSSVIPVSPSFRSVTSVSPLLRSSFISVSPLLHSITSVLPIFRRFATKKEKPPTSGLKIIDATFNNKEGITMV